MTKSCLTCRWARWKNPPQINPNQVGRCTYQVPIEVFPAVVDVRLIAKINPQHGGSIWAGAPFEQCPVWAAKEEL
jgi:hypothetical protein